MIALCLNKMATSGLTLTFVFAVPGLLNMMSRTWVETGQCLALLYAPHPQIITGWVLKCPCSPLFH